MRSARTNATSGTRTVSGSRAIWNPVGAVTESPSCRRSAAAANTKARLPAINPATKDAGEAATIFPRINSHEPSAVVRNSCSAVVIDLAMAITTSLSTHH
jgi:hypothetical protein